MKSLIFLIIFLLGFLNFTYAQKDSLSIKNLQFKIDSMYTEQNSPFILSMQGSISGDSAQKLANKIHFTNYKVLKTIINMYAYPNINLKESKYLGEFNELIWNCDFDFKFQEKVLKLFKNKSNVDTALKSSKIYLNQLAGFIDKVEINFKRKQIYGTQVFFNEKTNLLELKPVSNMVNINTLRTKMQLEKIEMMLEKANKQLLLMRSR